MRLVILKDGTVPIVVLKEVGRDSADENVKREVESIAEELADSDLHSSVELFEVEDDSRYVVITWQDGWGFTVTGHDAEVLALDHLEDGEPGSARLYGPGHWGRVYGDEDADDCGYGHVFAI